MAENLQFQLSRSVKLANDFFNRNSGIVLGVGVLALIVILLYRK